MKTVNKDPDKDQVDGGIKRSETGIPDRSGRLTGHTKQPLKGTDPAEAEKKRVPRTSDKKPEA